MVRGIDSSLNPLNVPHVLHQMKGGVTASDTANDILFHFHTIKLKKVLMRRFKAILQDLLVRNQILQCSQHTSNLDSRMK